MNKVLAWAYIFAFFVVNVWLLRRWSNKWFWQGVSYGLLFFVLYAIFIICVISYA